jgi:hypothetical protein
MTTLLLTSDQTEWPALLFAICGLAALRSTETGLPNPTMPVLVAG